MHRRSLLKLFLTLSGLIPAIGRTLTLENHRQEKNCNTGNYLNNQLTSFMFEAEEYEWPCFSVGDEFELRRDSENVQDPHAVVLYWYANTRIDGYVPRPENAGIAKLLDNGMRLKCCIVEKTESERDIPGILFSVYIA